MKVDMSAQGVTTRLKRASQLRDLCLSLGKAKAANPKTDKPSSRLAGELPDSEQGVPVKT